MEEKSLFTSKRLITGNWVAVMNHERHDRALHLSHYRTRCISAGEVHEFLICDNATDITLPINDVAYLGFGELELSGVLEIGDYFYCEEKLIGRIIGFDETHFPNHYNIVLQGDYFATGAVLGFSLHKCFSIIKPVANLFIKP
jgi:hypothetical protein